MRAVALDNNIRLFPWNFLKHYGANQVYNLRRSVGFRVNRVRFSRYHLRQEWRDSWRMGLNGL